MVVQTSSPFLIDSSVLCIRGLLLYMFLPCDHDKPLVLSASSVTGGELFEDIVAREYYSEADARWVQFSACKTHTHKTKSCYGGVFSKPLL